jgi:hypothetical protein
MYCPQCGSQNNDMNRFCVKCGSSIPDQKTGSQSNYSTNPSYTITKIHRPIISSTTLFGISSIGGGGLTLLGWFIPWFSLGGLTSGLLSLLSIGSGFSPIKFGSGVGNGLQIGLIALFAGFASFTAKESIVTILGCVSILIAAALFAIPIIAISIIRSGLEVVDIGRDEAPETAFMRAQKVKERKQIIKSNSTTVFVILAIIFILLSALPFGTALLATGFYLSLAGTVISFLGAYFAKYQFKPSDKSAN